MDIGEWLDGLGLGQYASSFEENDIDADLLAVLTESDLKELGIRSLGHRKRIFAAIRELRKTAEVSRETSRQMPVADVEQSAASSDVIPIRVRPSSVQPLPRRTEPERPASRKPEAPEPQPERTQSAPPETTAREPAGPDLIPEPVSTPVHAPEPPVPEPDPLPREPVAAASTAYRPESEADTDPEPPVRITETSFSPDVRRQSERHWIAVLVLEFIGGPADRTASLDGTSVEGEPAVLRRIYNHAETNGGRVVRADLEGVEIHFGPAVAEQEDVKRALRTCLAIRKDLSSAGDGGHKGEVRIGIASGSVLNSGTEASALHEQKIIADTSNLALRLKNTARAGDAIVTNDVYRQVSQLVQCDPAGDVARPDGGGMVAVWLIRSPNAPVKKLAISPLVGRETEIERFSNHLKGARSSMRGQASMIVGEPGCGKSRLLEEFEKLASEEGYEVIKLKSVRDRLNETIICQLLCRLMELRADAGPQERAKALDAMISSGRVPKGDKAFLLNALALPQTAETRVTFDLVNRTEWISEKRRAIRALFRAARDNRRLCISVDDIHHARASDMLAFASLVRDFADQEVVTLCAARRESAPLHPDWVAALQANDSRTVKLDALSSRDAAVLVKAYGDPDDPRLMQCAARAQGNPLYLEQLLFTAVSDWTIDIPASFQALVLARLEMFSQDDRDALLAASVLGEHFSISGLRFVLDDEDYDPKSLVEDYILSRDGHRLCFRQPMFQEAVYSLLHKQTRRDLHLRAAGYEAEVDPVVYARHLERSGDKRAPLAFAAAARRYARVLDLDDALAMTKLGLQIVAEPQDRWTLTCLEGDYLMQLGQPADALQAYRKASVLAAEDPRHRAMAALGEAEALLKLDKSQEAMETLDAACQAAEDGHLVTELADLLAAAGNASYRSNEIEKAERQAKQALKLAKSVSHWEALANAHLLCGEISAARARMASATDHFRQASQIAAKVEQYGLELTCSAKMVRSQLYCDPLGELAEEIGSLIARAKQFGDRNTEIELLLTLICAQYELANYVTAVEQADVALELIDTAGTLVDKPYVYAFKARSLLELREDDRARAMLGEAIKISRDNDPGQSGAIVLGGIILAARKDKTREGAFGEATRILKRGATSQNYLRFYRDAIDAALLSGKFQDAVRYSGHLEKFTRHEKLPWADFFVARGRALAAVGQGSMNAKLKMELRRLSAEAKRLGYIWARKAVQNALGGPESVSEQSD